VLLAIGYWVYFDNRKISDFILPIGSLGGVFIFYYAIRIGVGIVAGKSNLQDTELLNNPYLLADEGQVKPTQMFMNIKYFILLLFPQNLSCDYSYNVVPYKNWNDLGVLSSLLLMIGGIVALIRTTLKRHWLAFPLAFALLHLFLVNNFFFNIGATMGERLVYHTSLGFIMIFLWACHALFTKLKMNPTLPTSGIAVLFLLFYAYTTYARNPAWKNDIVLHLTDVQHKPESTMLNGNACTRLIELAEMPKNAAIATRLLDSAKGYGFKSLKLHDRFVNSYLNVGIIEAKQGKYDSAAIFWGKVEEFYPNHPQLLLIKQNLASNFMNKAMEYVNKKDFPNALLELKKAYQKNKTDINLLNNLGGVSFNLGDFAGAKRYWMEGLSLAPNDANLNQGINALKSAGKF
jgi:protein O-mannosyl-transferase